MLLLSFNRKAKSKRKNETIGLVFYFAPKEECSRCLFSDISPEFFMPANVNYGCKSREMQYRLAFENLFT
jgi:hypothetical protein